MFLSDGKLYYRQTCTSKYFTTYKKPSAKVSPTNIDWPFSEEEDKWDAKMKTIKKSKADQIWKLDDVVLATKLDSKQHPSVQPYMLKRKNETLNWEKLSICEMMDIFGVVKPGTVRWKNLTTAYYQPVPAPWDVFNCTQICAIDPAAAKLYAQWADLAAEFRRLNGPNGKLCSFENCFFIQKNTKRLILNVISWLRKLYRKPAAAKPYYNILIPAPQRSGDKKNRSYKAKVPRPKVRLLCGNE
jgi:hypothetical protein